MKHIFTTAFLFFCIHNLAEDSPKVLEKVSGQVDHSDFPASIHPLQQKDQQIVLLVGDEAAYEIEPPSPFKLSDYEKRAEGTETGILMVLGDRQFKGILYYGFINYGDSKHPHPVYYKRIAKIENGVAEIPIKKHLRGDYDSIGWEETGFGVLGYRIISQNGQMIYDGKIAFSGIGPFKVLPTIVEGPFVHNVTPSSVTISFETDRSVPSNLKLNDMVLSRSDGVSKHLYEIKGLLPDSEYEYHVTVGFLTETYTFKTSPKPGSRKQFKFAYASDSRGGTGGGERDIYGTNAYILKKIMAFSTFSNCVFFQFSGDLIDGYLHDQEGMKLQYRNFKRAIEPFAHHFPVYVSMGNHELLMRSFKHGETIYPIDQFPFEWNSAEALFANEFVNPESDLVSEDGSVWDPDPGKTDFPPYKENVFMYSYDNVAVVVLNSDYWYAPYLWKLPESGGNLHGYIMDNQLAWFEKTLMNLEMNVNIDHVFVTMHTPMFPNSAHVRDDMWYGGNNQMRPTISGKPVEKGIIERRDELLDVMINKTTKTVAVLTGDEHNYCKTVINDQMSRYPQNYQSEKVALKREIYQVNNGAAGAPYYAQTPTPWSEFTSNFTTQNALVIFEVDGLSVTMEVINPDTLESIDSLKLR